MADEPTESDPQQFLPPEPGGAEPDLGQAPPPPPPQPPQPPPAYQAPPRAYQPPPSYQPPPPGYQPPPPGYQPPPPQQPQWGWQPTHPPVPDNGSAVAGFTLSASAATLLLMSGGLSSIASIVCSGLGIFYSRKGRERVDRGETPKHRGLAQAGFVTGIVSLVLSLLATAFWVLILVLYITSESFRDDINNESDGSGDGIETSLRVGALVVRGIAALIT